ncbi:MAG TPA: hypothetical protein VMX18_01590 [Candidatus Bipolaricaulota bacterium]|nr:hypothetical protein [Candidatus Bipolaricaulota bacterium]
MYAIIFRPGANLFWRGTYGKFVNRVKMGEISVSSIAMPTPSPSAKKLRVRCGSGKDKEVFIPLVLLMAVVIGIRKGVLFRGQVVRHLFISERWVTVQINEQALLNLLPGERGQRLAKSLRGKLRIPREMIKICLDVRPVAEGGTQIIWDANGSQNPFIKKES